MVLKFTSPAMMPKSTFILYSFARVSDFIHCSK